MKSITNRRSNLTVQTSTRMTRGGNEAAYANRSQDDAKLTQSSKRHNSKQGAACAQSRSSARGIRWIIAVLCVALIIPIVGWFGLVLAGNQWIDEAELNNYYNQVNSNEVLSNGQPIVRVEEMPPYVIDSLIAIEDHRYYLHPGIDPVSLMRSVWVNLQEQSKAQGGSTITMQLARNLFLSQDKTYSRKIKEVAVAANLEWRYSKEDILNLYLNKVYFGHGVYGIEAAANYYFGKTTKLDSGLPVVTQAETAMLVGLLKAPEHYSPFKDPESALHRQQVVLDRMHELGWLSDSEWLTAMHEELHLNTSFVKQDQQDQQEPKLLTRN
ncbi:transglycosylase domain-containing protein [Paenibacillus marinisediminis]